MIRALDFTSNVISDKVLEKILEEAEITGDRVVDYTGTVFHSNTYEIIAEHFLYFDINFVNIEKRLDYDMINYNILKLQQPRVGSMAEFKEVFAKRFPEGEICILDKTSEKMLKKNMHNRKVIVVEKIMDRGVRVRVYHSSKMQPYYFREYGPDNKELFSITEISFIDLYNQEVIIDYPRDEREREILDILFFGE